MLRRPTLLLLALYVASIATFVNGQTPAVGNLLDGNFTIRTRSPTVGWTCSEAAPAAKQVTGIFDNYMAKRAAFLSQIANTTKKCVPVVTTTCSNVNVGTSSQPTAELTVVATYSCEITKNCSYNCKNRLIKFATSEVVRIEAELKYCVDLIQYNQRKAYKLIFNEQVPVPPECDAVGLLLYLLYGAWLGQGGSLPSSIYRLIHW